MIKTKCKAGNIYKITNKPKPDIASALSNEKMLSLPDTEKNPTFCEKIKYIINGISPKSAIRI